MIIELTGVEKRYGETRALAGMDLTVPEGSVFGLIGPNGAGKTTSMLIISSLLARDGGRVRVVGTDPQTDPKAVRRMLGYMPDFFGFYENLSTVEYLDFFAAAQRIPPPRRPALIADLLALVDLEDKADTEVNSLSRGMKQRLSLARALVHDPDVLVLDEPASGLDPRARIQQRELIAELARLGKTIVISSHILSELEGICSHLAVVDDGLVKTQGTMEEIRQTLTATNRIVARVADEHIDDAHDLIAGTGEVDDVAVESGLIRFSFHGGDDESAGILARLVTAGIPVYEWRVESAGLEEVFMHVTGEGP